MSLPRTGLFCTEQEGLLIRWDYATVRDRLTFGKYQNPFPKPHMDTRRETALFRQGAMRNTDPWRCKPCSKKETAEFTKPQGKYLTSRNTQQHIWKVLSNHKMLFSWNALPDSKGHLPPMASSKGGVSQLCDHQATVFLLFSPQESNLGTKLLPTKLAFPTSTHTSTLRSCFPLLPFSPSASFSW